MKECLFPSKIFSRDPGTLSFLVCLLAYLSVPLWVCVSLCPTGWGTDLWEQTTMHDLNWESSIYRTDILDYGGQGAAVCLKRT